MQPPLERYSVHAPSTSSPRIPSTQAQALDRRQLLDQQQRAFQGAHLGVRHELLRRRPPA
ncbi:MAG: hypothetical protein ACLP7Q_12065 [Isosphaeraceae bacterium]